MADKEGKRPYSALTDAEDLSAGTDVAPDGDYSLEEILAEYGGGRRRHILDEVDGALESAAAPAEEAPEADAPGEDALGKAPAQPPEPPAPEREEVQEAPEETLPPPPRPVPIEQAVGQTVGDLMDRQALETDHRPRRGLFSRKRVRMEETEQLYEPPGPPPEPEPEEPPIGPEEPLDKAA